MHWMLLSGCALITQAEYEARMNPDGVDTGDSGGEGGIEVSGSLSVASDREPLNQPDEARVAIVEVRMVPDPQPGEDFVFLGEVLGSGTVGGLSAGVSRPYKFSIPGAPPEEHFYELESAFADGATYMIGAWDDADGDRWPGPSEAVVGGNASQLLAYVREPVDAALFPEEGWYLVSLAQGEEGGVTDVFAIEDAFFVYDLEANLLPNDRHTRSVGGGMQDGLGATVLSPRACVFDITQLERAFQGEALEHEPVLVDTTIGGDDARFQFSDGLGLPAPEHLATETADGGSYEPYGVEVASYIVVGYDDQDLDEELTLKLVGGDDLLGTSMQAGDLSTFLTYYRPVDLRAAFTLDQGVDAGWNLVSFTEGGGVLPWDTPIVLDDRDFGD